MKSSSDVRPAIILPLGNGSYHYNYNIVEEKVEDPETGEKDRLQLRYGAGLAEAGLRKPYACGYP